MDAWRVRSFVVNNLNWTGIFLLLLTISIPTDGRPVKSTSGSTTLDELSPHKDEPLFFDSQRNTESDSFKLKPLNNSGMIVRVIVTSSSSSSSSDSEDSDFSSFHDFQFPHDGSETQTSTDSISSTVKPTTFDPKYSESAKIPNTFETLPKNEVEDIFSAFYRAFSQASRSPGFSVRDSRLPLMSDLRNEEGFQGFPQSNKRKTKNRNDESGQGKITAEEKFEDEEAAADNSSSNTAIISSSVAVSHHTSSQSVANVAPRNRKVSLSTSTSSSISVGGNITSSSRNRSRVVKPELFNRRSRVTPRPTNSGNVNVRYTNNNNRNIGERQVTQAPEAQPIFQHLPPLPTPTKKSREKPTSSSPMSWQQPEKVWSEPAKVWSLPAQVWSEPEKVWGQPAKNWGQAERNWGQPEKVWGQQERSWGQTSQSKSEKRHQSVPTLSPVNVNLNSRRSIYEPKVPKSHEKTGRIDIKDSKEGFESQEDEDYQRDSAQPEGGESTQGTFVILGDDENEQDSIDGEFDRHLVLPVSTSTTSKPNHSPYNHNTNRNNNLNSYQNSSRNSTSFSTSTDTNPNNFNNSQLANNNPNNSSKKGKKFGYVLEGSNVRRYRVEERTPDGFIVGEYGVLNNQNAFLRGVRYTADGTINPRLIHEALMKFLSLRRR